MVAQRKRTVTAGDHAVLYGLSVAATYRLVRLAIADEIFDEPRELLHEWCEQGGAFRDWLYALITCPWCLGVWFSGFLTVATRRHRRGGFIYGFVWWMAVAAFQPWVHMVEGIVHAINRTLNPDDDDSK